MNVFVMLHYTGVWSRLSIQLVCLVVVQDILTKNSHAVGNRNSLCSGKERRMCVVEIKTEQITLSLLVQWLGLIIYITVSSWFLLGLWHHFSRDEHRRARISSGLRRDRHLLHRGVPYRLHGSDRSRLQNADIHQETRFRRTARCTQAYQTDPTAPPGNRK